MASTKAYLDFVQEQFSGLEDVRFRPMMGEYVLYLRGKVIGGVYDDRLLLKQTPGAVALLRESKRELLTDLPYEGAKPMLVADVDDARLIRRMAEAIAEDLPAKRRKT